MNTNNNDAIEDKKKLTNVIKEIKNENKNDSQCHK